MARNVAYVPRCVQTGPGLAIPIPEGQSPVCECNRPTLTSDKYTYQRPRYAMHTPHLATSDVLRKALQRCFKKLSDHFRAKITLNYVGQTVIP